MRKKMISCLILIALVTGVFGCGAQEEKKSPEHTIKLKCAYFAIGADFRDYQERLNEEFKNQGLPYEIEFDSPDILFKDNYKEYVDAYADAIRSGGYDLIHCNGRINSYVVQEVLAEQGLLLPLNELLSDSDEGRQLQEAYPQNVWDALSFEGETYGAPTLLGNYRYYVVVNMEYAEKYGIAASDINFQKLDEILRIVTEGEKAAGNNSFIGTTPLSYFLQGDYEFSRCEPVCVDTGGKAPVAESIVENEAFISWIKTLNVWNKEGIMKTGMNRQITQGNFFMTGRYSYSPEAAVAGSRAEYDISPDVELEAVELSEFSKQALDKTTAVMGVSAYSEHPEEAFKALAALYSNAELSNALAYGKEGVNYRIENGKVVIVDNSQEDEIRREYFGNSLLTLPSEKDSSEKQKELWNTVEELHVSAQEQLIYDEELNQKMGELTTWYLDEYSFAVSGESQDIETDLEKLRMGARERGIEEVVEEFNRQYQAGAGFR